MSETAATPTASTSTTSSTGSTTTSSTTSLDDIAAAVQDRYAEAARTAAQGQVASVIPDLFGAGLYTEQADTVPEGAVSASLGCGNPTRLAHLRPGETVLDLGAGGGLDVLLAAKRVGPTGRVYGLDMTPEMIELARRHQAEAGVTNAEFLLGRIEEIPLPDASVDVIISNCVINLSGDKDAVFSEMYRVLRPGGRIAVSDIVARRELPAAVRALMVAWTGCVAGALVQHDYLARLEAAGFTEVTLTPEQVFSLADIERMAADMDVSDEVRAAVGTPGVLEALDDATMSAHIAAVKPRG